MLEVAYLKIGIEFIWEFIPYKLDLTCTESMSRFNQEGPYAAITGSCRLEFNDVGFKSIFGKRLESSSLGYSKGFYSIPYIYFFARTTVIALPLLPAMYQNYVTGPKLEEQQLELYKEEVDRYLKTRSTAKHSFCYHDSTVIELKSLKFNLTTLLENVDKAVYQAETNAKVTFDASCSKLSTEITDHLTNLELLSKIDASTTRGYIKPVDVNKLTAKLNQLAKEFTSIKTKYPEAFL